MELYIDNIPLETNTLYPVTEIEKLQFLWNTPNEKTLVFYDLDASYIHLLITNIPDNRIEEGQVVYSYMAPQPPANSQDHRYVFILFEQPSLIQTIYKSQRSKFPLKDFIDTYQLKTIGSKMLVVNPQTLQFYLSETKIYNLGGPLLETKSSLNEQQQKYCSCVAKVTAKNPEWCNKEQAWGESRNGSKCYSPYKVCAKTVGTTTRDCSYNYNYDAMSDAQLSAFATLHKINIQQPYNRHTLLQSIKSKYNL
jgi:hypothetical protein